MARGKYHRSQAQLFAGLAATTSNPAIAERYSLMALEQLAKADEVELGAGDQRPAPTPDQSDINQLELLDKLPATDPTPND